MDPPLTRHRLDSKDRPVNQARQHFCCIAVAIIPRVPGGLLRWCLSRSAAHRISAAMQPTLTFLVALLLTVGLMAGTTMVRAQGAGPVRPAVPKSIGKFDAWQAATHQEGGQLVCYAFTRASASTPALPGRGDVVLTVTHRTGGRDAVALTAGFAYPASAEVQVVVEPTQLQFYTSNRSAFSQDGKAAVTAFERGRQAVAKSPAPRNAIVTDTFSLRGFTQAYAAINKACPVK